MYGLLFTLLFLCSGGFLSAVAARKVSPLRSAREQAFLTRLIGMALLLCAVLLPSPIRAQDSPPNTWLQHSLSAGSPLALTVIALPPGGSVSVLSLRDSSNKETPLFLLRHANSAWRYGTKEVLGLKQIRVETKNGLTTLTFITNGDPVQSHLIPGATRLKYDPKVFTLSASEAPSTGLNAPPGQRAPDVPGGKDKLIAGIAIVLTITVVALVVLLVWLKRRNQQNGSASANAGAPSKSTGNSTPTAQVPAGLPASNAASWPAWSFRALLNGDYNTSLNKRYQDIDSRLAQLEKSRTTTAASRFSVNSAKDADFNAVKAQIAQAENQAISELLDTAKQEKKIFNDLINAAKADLENKKAFASIAAVKKQNEYLEKLDAKQEEIIALMEEFKKGASDGAYAVQAKQHLKSFLEELTANIDAAGNAAQKVLDEKATALDQKADEILTRTARGLENKQRETEDKQRQAERILNSRLADVEKYIMDALEQAKSAAAADAAQEMIRASETFTQQMSAMEREVKSSFEAQKSELLQTLAAERTLAKDALQQMVSIAETSRAAAEAESVRIAAMLADAQNIKAEADAALAQREAVIQQAQEAVTNAVAAGKQISGQVEKLQAQLDRVDRLDNIMTAFQGAIHQIQTASPALVPAQSPHIGTSLLEASAGQTAGEGVAVVAVPPLPAAVTKGGPEFDYLTLFMRVVNAKWPEILTAARSNNERYFTEARQRDMDMALYGDAAQLLGAQPEYKDWISDLAAELKTAQQQRIKELAEAGMSRIEGHPGDRERSYWLEADPESSVPTTDPFLAGTFADIEPGKGGYKLNNKALRPSKARFYRLVQS